MAAQEEFLNITVTVQKKTFILSCGDGNYSLYKYISFIYFVYLCSGSQRLKWLGHVAIARWDEESNQGWKWLGTPIAIKNAQGNDLDQGLIIKDVLQNGESITVHCSLDPMETRSP